MEIATVASVIEVETKLSVFSLKMYANAARVIANSPSPKNSSKRRYKGVEKVLNFTDLDSPKSSSSIYSNFIAFSKSACDE